MNRSILLGASKHRMASYKAYENVCIVGPFVICFLIWFS